GHGGRSSNRAGVRCAAFGIDASAYAWNLMAPPTSPTGRVGAGIPGSELSGPYPVGEYAAALRDRLRSFTRVQLIGELVNLRQARARVYFELRDGTGAIPCSAWRNEWEATCERAG